MIVTITSTRPFNTSNGPALNYTGTYDRGAIEGVIWNHPLQPSIHPGAQLDIVEVAANWGDYQGKPRYNIRTKDSVTLLAAGGATPQPAQQAQAAPQPTAYPQPALAVQEAPQAQAGGKGEKVLNRAAELVDHFYKALTAKGIPPESAILIAAQAPQIVALWWFGEKEA